MSIKRIETLQRIIQDHIACAEHHQAKADQHRRTALRLRQEVREYEQLQADIHNLMYQG